MTICGEKLYILSRSGDERAKDAHNVNLSLSMKLKTSESWYISACFKWRGKLSGERIVFCAFIVQEVTL